MTNEERVCSPWWPTEHGLFLPFQPPPERFSAETLAVIERLRSVEVRGTIFLRGSLVEVRRPFAGSDVDLLLILEDGAPIPWLGSLSTRPLDVKLLSRRRLDRDLVQRALVTHRAVLVQGPHPNLQPVAANDEFAWRQWLACLPVGLPSEIDSRDALAIQVFKSATRAFGVLSLLLEGRYTRDIDACLDFAEGIAREAAASLKSLRAALESRTVTRVAMSGVRSDLLELHRRHG
jgi:hypothetical protein